jgi:hypothetical protein
VGHLREEPEPRLPGRGPGPARDEGRAGERTQPVPIDAVERGERVARWQDDAEVLGEQVLVHPRARREVADECDVVGPGLQPLGLLAPRPLHNGDHGTRCLSPEFGEHGSEDRPRRGRDEPDGHHALAALGGPADAVERPLRAGQQSGSLVEQRPTRRRGRDPARGPLQQERPHVLLQRLQAPGQRWLRDPQQRGRTPDVTLAGRHGEGLQQEQVELRRTHARNVSAAADRSLDLIERCSIPSRA